MADDLPPARMAYEPRERDYTYPARDRGHEDVPHAVYRDADIIPSSQLVGGFCMQTSEGLKSHLQKGAYSASAYVKESHTECADLVDISQKNHRKQPNHSTEAILPARSLLVAVQSPHTRVSSKWHPHGHRRWARWSNASPSRCAGGPCRSPHG